MKKEVLLSLVSIACASNNLETRSVQNYSTILFVNESFEPITLRSRSGRIGEVYPNQRECFVIREITPMFIYFEYRGRNYRTPEFIPTDFYGGWSLRIGNNPRVDILNLIPTRRCQ